MDAHDGAADAAVSAATKAWREGAYLSAVDVLKPWAGGQKVLRPSRQRDVEFWMSRCHRFLFNFKEALLHAERSVELSSQPTTFGPRSREHAVALRELSMVRRGLKEYPAARKNLVEALAIMEERGLGSLSYFEGRHREALLTYDKAMVVLQHFKGQREYGVLLSSMAICHQALHQWAEALALSKEAVEHRRDLYGPSHAEYATALHSLANLHARQKDHKDAMLRFEEALAIYQQVYGKQHERTVETSKALADVRKAAEAERNGSRTSLVVTPDGAPKDWRNLRHQPLPVRFFELARQRGSKVERRSHVGSLDHCSAGGISVQRGRDLALSDMGRVCCAREDAGPCHHCIRCAQRRQGAAAL
jgi:tetratricopeptide (TPR) repeat protein